MTPGLSPETGRVNRRHVSHNPNASATTATASGRARLDRNWTGRARKGVVSSRSGQPTRANREFNGLSLRSRRTLVKVPDKDLFRKKTREFGSESRVVANDVEPVRERVAQARPAG